MGATVDLILTSAEVEHLALTVDLRTEEWPDGVEAGGSAFRIQFIKDATASADGMYAFTRAELWLLDGVLLKPDPRGAKLPNGEPVYGLLKKIWAALVESYAEKEANNGNRDRDHDHHAGTYHGAGDEAALRSG